MMVLQLLIPTQTLRLFKDMPQQDFALDRDYEVR
eukprot:gene4783-34540_t